MLMTTELGSAPSVISPTDCDAKCVRVRSLSFPSVPKITIQHRHEAPERSSDREGLGLLLNWLGPEPELAGQRYELIRQKLITMFAARSCICPEDLADATFDRVARKLPTLLADYEGDPAPYFYGVAKKIHLEYCSKPLSFRFSGDLSGNEAITGAQAADEEHLRMLEKIDEALSELSAIDREIILRYYAACDGREKIEERRALARQFGMRPGVLRLRAFRIRSRVRDYVVRAIEREANQDVASPTKVA